MNTTTKVLITIIILSTIFSIILLTMPAGALLDPLELSETTLGSNPTYKKDSPYGTCGPSDWPEEYYNYTVYVNTPYQVADPLYGKDLYIFYISQITEQYYPAVDPYIALAVLELESNYIPDLTSRVGAVGLMQVLPKYHARRVEKYGLNDLWDPYTNIICGIDLLDELYSKKGDWSKALLGYNNSTTYVKRVLNKADILRGDGYFG